MNRGHTGKGKACHILLSHIVPFTLQQADRDKFTGKVVEVVNGDALVVRRQEGTNKKIFLSSIRPPR